jgi:hypothetical protein
MIPRRTSREVVGVCDRRPSKRARRQRRTNNNDDDDDGDDDDEFELKNKSDSADQLIEFVGVDDLQENVWSDNCFGCVCNFHISQKAVIKDPNVARLVEEFQNNISSMHPYALAKLIARLFHTTIYRPQIKAGHKMLNWPAKQVLKHMISHMTDPEIQLQKRLHRLNTIEDNLAKCGFNRPAGTNGKPTATPQALLLMDKFVKTTVLVTKELAAMRKQG